MKRIIIFLIIILCAIPMPVMAGNGMYTTAGELYQAWCHNLPDYICGVWSTDGGMDNVTFGIQNNEAGNLGMQEILSLIEYDDSATFVYQQYSRNYLLQILADMQEYFAMDQGVKAAGLDDMRNCVTVEICGLYRSNNDTANIVAELDTRYKDAVCIIYTDCTGSFIDGTYVEDHTCIYELTTRTESNTFHMLYVGLACFMVVFTLTLILVFRKRMLIMQTNTGTQVHSVQTIKDVKAAVREQVPEYPSGLDNIILEMYNYR